MDEEGREGGRKRERGRGREGMRERGHGGKSGKRNYEDEAKNAERKRGMEWTIKEEVSRKRRQLK